MFTEQGDDMMGKQVRMADIAEKLGISIVSVSKALRGKDGVGEKRRAEILRTADELGYVRNVHTSGTAGFSVGILTSGRYLARGASFYWELYERLLTHLRKGKDFGMLEVVSLEDETQCAVPRLVLENRVQGLIVMGKLGHPYINMIAGLGIPFTMLDTYEIGMPYDTVLSAGYSGMCEMTQYLIAQGHRRLKFVGTVGATSSITDRYFGFCRAMAEAGLPVTPDLVIPDRDANGATRIELSPRLPETATALVCNCDYTAYHVLKQLTVMGIRVPEEISIVGYDNYVLSEMGSVGITTYRVDQNEMAGASADQIRRRILSPDAGREIITVHGEILVRESCAPVNGK